MKNTEKEFTITQDNHEKLQVTFTEAEFIRLSGTFFNWRKLSWDRITKLGSIEYDSFIEYCYKVKNNLKIK